MGMNIKNENTHALARELAAIEQATVTDAVSTALREALARRRQAQSSRRERVMHLLARIREHLGKTEGLSLHAVSESLYDEHGLPR